MTPDEDAPQASVVIKTWRWLLAHPVIVGLVAGILAGLLIWGQLPDAPAKYADVKVAVTAAAPTETTPAKDSKAITTAPEKTAEKAVVVSPLPAPPVDIPAVAEAAVVISDTGLNHRVAESIDKSLPRDITLAISAYATDPAGMASAFKASGRDVWMQVATQSTKPGIDPGPLAVSGNLEGSANMELIKRQISNIGAGNVVGLFIPGDADVIAQSDMWRDLAMDLIADNMMIMDATPTKVATALYMQKSESKISAYLKADLVVSGADGPASLQQKLADALPVIMAQQQAIIVLTDPSVPAIETVAAWINGFAAKGIRLVPASRFTGLTGK